MIEDLDLFMLLLSNIALLYLFALAGEIVVARRPGPFASRMRWDWWDLMMMMMTRVSQTPTESACAGVAAIVISTPVLFIRTGGVTLPPGGEMGKIQIQLVSQHAHDSFLAPSEGGTVCVEPPW